MMVAMLAVALLTASPQPLTVVAHRGLGEGVPENTLAAFLHSIANGVRIIELDLRTTKDGRLVILHDATLDRTTDCSGAVAEKSLDALKACDAGWPTHVGQRIPTLGDVFALIDGTSTRLMLDCKAAPLDDVLRAVRAHHAESRVILGLRSPAQVARARAALPGVAIIAFMPARTDGPAFTAAGANILRLWSDWVEADPALVGRTRALGPQIWIMVGRRLPAKPADWRALHSRMIAAGAQGLITDRPEFVRAQ